MRGVALAAAAGYRQDSFGYNVRSEPADQVKDKIDRGNAKHRTNRRLGSDPSDLRDLGIHASKTEMTANDRHHECSEQQLDRGLSQRELRNAGAKNLNKSPDRRSP